MRIAQSLVLIGALTASTPAATPAAAQAAARVIPQAQLPGDFRQQLPRGEVSRVFRTGVDTVAMGREVVLRRGEVLAVRTGDSAIALPREPGRGPASTRIDSAFGLPLLYLGLDAKASAPTTYRPTYVLRGPLRYRAEQDAFLGSFLLGLQDSAHPTAIRDLSAPVRMRFAGDADSVTPDSVLLQQTNAQMEEIRVFVRTAFDSIRLLVVPPFDPRGVPVWIRIEPALAFDQAPAAIQGWGVQEATLILGRRGTRASDSTPVTLSATRGSVETNRIMVADAGAVVRIRSEGLGQATIRASAPGLVPAVVTITYGWPIAFVTAAVLGGVLGGLVAHLRTKRRSRTSLPVSVVTGVLIGLLTCAAYLGLDINILTYDVKVQFVNELVIFGLAALAGAGGVAALSLAAKVMAGK